jgi:hypothetical protein
MLLIVLALLTTPITGVAPQQSSGACKWVRGRFNVWNGSSVRRIWVIGTHHLVALRDDDESAPKEIQKYIYSGPFLTKADGLFGDFRVCALEHAQVGHMQHVRVTATRHLTFRGRRFE